MPCCPDEQATAEPGKEPTPCADSHRHDLALSSALSDLLMNVMLPIRAGWVFVLVLHRAFGLIMQAGQTTTVMLSTWQQGEMMGCAT